jgi:MFS family permease
MYANDEGSILDDRQRRSPATQDDLLGKSEPVLSRRARWITGPFVRLLATNMAFGFSISCFFLLPKYLTVACGATPGTVGAVMGVFGLTCVLVVPWLGRSVNALGLARTLCFGQLLMAGCSLAFVLFPRVGPAMLVLRALQGLATAGVMTAGVALVCELSPPHRLGQAMGLAGAASLIMNAIAPAVAEPIEARYGFAWVFVLSGLAALLGAALARKLPVARHRLRIVAPIRIPRQARPILLALALSGAGFYVVISFLAPLAIARGVPVVSGFFAAYTLAALAVRILGGAATDRLGLRWTALAGMLLYGAVIAAIAGVGPRSMVAIGLVFGLAHGALFPALMALLFADSKPAQRAHLAGFSNGVMSLGMLTVLGFGQMANQFGLVPVFLCTGGLVGASALLVLGSQR